MTASIFKALASGFTADTILKQIAKQFPKHASKINAARAYGYLAPSILKQIVDPRGDSSKTDDYLTENEKAQRNYKKQTSDATQKVVGALGTAGAIGAGLYALGKNPGSALNPGQNGANAASQQSQPITPSPTTQGPVQQPQGPVQSFLNNKLPSPTTATQPLNPPIDVSESRTLKQFPQLSSYVKKHIESGKSPEETYGLLQKSPTMAPIVKNFEQEHKQSLLESIPTIGKGAPKEAMKSMDTVVTPFGAGTIHKTKGDDAYVEVGSKLKKVPVSEIEPPSEDVIKAVSNILNIPEVDRSSNVSLFTYDPAESKMYVQFHNGETYKYLDVDPEKVYTVANKLGIPVTEGENVFGAWSPEDKKSLGAALWQQFLSDPKYKRSKKGEPANPNYIKLDTLYDYWELLRKKKR